MPSPFPGMDPFLEGYLWPDVHHALTNKICQLIGPRLRPRYVARLKIVVIDDQPPDSEIRIMYPYVEVVLAKRAHRFAPLPQVALAQTVTMDEAAVTIPYIETRVASVEVRDVASNQLVTVIEILSPVNKREPGYSKYRNKRTSLHQSNVHLLEIDLLRRGLRVLSHRRLDGVPYLVALSRAQTNTTNVWPLRLPDKLPTVPVPLRDPDPNVPLSLSEAMTQIYDEAGYDLSIDYRQSPPPPPLSDDEVEWVGR